MSKTDSQISSLGEANNFSIAWFARRLGMSRDTISRRIEGMQPDGKEAGYSTYNFRKVMDAVYSTAQDDAIDPNGEPKNPRDLKDYYDARLKKLEFERQVAQVIPANEVHSLLADISKKTALAFDTLADVLERDAGLNAEQINVVQRVCDDVRTHLYSDVTAD